jgi:hypothetical protein
MKKLIAGALAALAVTGGAAATATPAVAAPWHGGSYHHGGGWGAGAAVGAGLVGLAVGAAIADHPHYAYGPGYYAPGYYGSGYYGCRSAVRWNPYWGDYQRVRACY